MSSTTTALDFQIPSFTELVGTLNQAGGGLPSQLEARIKAPVQPAAQTAAPAQADQIDQAGLPDDVPKMPPNSHMRHWGQATLQIRDLHNEQFNFILRSKVNSPLLSGGPLPATADLMSAAKQLLSLCSRESNFRIAQAGNAFELCLLDNQAQILGRSVKITTEAVAIAMLKLVTVQAQRARIAFKVD